MAWFAGSRTPTEAIPPAEAASQAGLRRAAGVEARNRLITVLAVESALAIVTALAIRRLRDFPYPLAWRAAFAGALSMLPQTGVAAIKVWSFLSVGIAVAAGLLIRVEPELGLGDAILGGAAVLWVGAYVLGQALGPIGLFRAPTIWIVIALGAIWLWRYPPRLRFTPLDSGQKLALLAFGMLAISMIPLQLASPVVPFMDVLSYPASAQRILTFGVYLPFDNDPYGQWGPYAQTPALELLYAAVAMGSHSRLAVLAESAMMVPMAALIIFGVYRLGKTLFDPAAGGMAALLLFFTCLFRRAQGMRGTAVDFALVGIGLAFFLDTRRSRLRMALGAVILGTAVASHAIIGGLAMIVAGAGLLFWLAEADYARFAIGVRCLAGATLVAIPEIAIGMAVEPRYPILPLCQIAGIALIATGASRLAAHPSRDTRSLVWLNWTIVLALFAAIIYRHATVPGSIYEQVAGHLPMLVMFAFGGMAALLSIWWREPATMRYGGVAAFALMLAIASEYLGEFLNRIAASPSSQMMVWDIGIKAWDYWSPYFLLFPAGLLFALLYERWSKPATMFALLTILIYPWHQGQNADYDSDQHAVTEQWAFNLATAARGYWVGSADPRWTFGPAERELLHVLNQEIAAGRITTATHILHIAESTSPWIFAHFSVFNGVNEDPIEFKPPSSTLWQAGSRVREIGELDRALAEKPPYILEQVRSPSERVSIPNDYEAIFNRDGLELYRRRAPKAPAPAKTP
ncbi:MAG: hypothetical protein ABSD31_07445 [Candidatus Binataceae bacterium]|jgi:hypothetical protein